MTEYAKALHWPILIVVPDRIKNLLAQQATEVLDYDMPPEFTSACEANGWPIESVILGFLITELIDDDPTALRRRQRGPIEPSDNSEILDQ